jgi:hypothetical protein
MRSQEDNDNLPWEKTGGVLPCWRDWDMMEERDVQDWSRRVKVTDLLEEENWLVLDLFNLALHSCVCVAWCWLFTRSELVDLACHLCMQNYRAVVVLDRYRCLTRPQLINHGRDILSTHHSNIEHASKKQKWYNLDSSVILGARVIDTSQ